MTDSRVVGRHQRGLLVAALADDQVVAVPASEGYALAACLHSDRALLALDKVAGRDATLERYAMVGRMSDAMALAAEWSEATRQLTEGVWPGPVTVVVPARPDAPVALVGAESSIGLAMPKLHILRHLCIRAGPLAVVLPGVGGAPCRTAREVQSRFAPAGLALVLGGGVRQGPGPTVVDCRVSPPVVRRVGELPEAYIDGVLLMAARRRKRFRFPPT